jgi:hypothetical protein
VRKEIADAIDRILSYFFECVLHPIEGIDSSKLAVWGRDMRYAVEPGVFEIMVGEASAETKTVSLAVQPK